MSLRFQVSDLLVSPGEARREEASAVASVELPNAVVIDPVLVDIEMRSLSDGVVVRGSISGQARLTCNRCLAEWDADVVVPFQHPF